ncbi:MAG: hypothetical protein J6X44_09575 [Thermoguttaceae bacterium]|nr:hypothetical protein [Thermoguttaceae bacterium]
MVAVSRLPNTWIGSRIQRALSRADAASTTAVPLIVDLFYEPSFTERTVFAVEFFEKEDNRGLRFLKYLLS